MRLLSSESPVIPCLRGGVKVLSRRRQGFESPWGRHLEYQGFQRFAESFFIFRNGYSPHYSPHFKWFFRIYFTFHTLYAKPTKGAKVFSKKQISCSQYQNNKVPERPCHLKTPKTFQNYKFFWLLNMGKNISYL
jgi:hypothetical protein